MRIRVSLAAVVVLGLSYAGATYLVSRQAESIVDRFYSDIEDSRVVRIVDRTYEGGFFSSRSTAKVELFGDFARRLVAQGLDARDPLPLPILVAIHSRIAHGPLPGLTTVGLAVIDSSLEFSEDISAELREIFGDREWVSIRNSVGFTGRSVLRIVGARGLKIGPPRGDEAPWKIEWQGMESEHRFPADFRTLQARATLPGITVVDPAAGGFQMRGLTLQSDMHRPFDDAPELWLGKGRWQLEELRFDHSGSARGASSRVGNLRVDGDAKASGEFVEWSVDVAVDELDVGPDGFGPLHVAAALQHVSKRGVIALAKAAAELDESPGALLDPESSLPVGPALLGALAEIVQQDPEFHVSKLSLRHPKGPIDLSASFALRGAGVDELDDLRKLLPKVEARIDISLPESLLVLAAAQKNGEQLKLVLAALVRQGYITEEGSQRKTRIETSGGSVTFNGKPLNAALLAALLAGSPT